MFKQDTSRAGKKVYHKFNDLYKGPFTIIEKFDNNAYRIQDRNSGAIYMHNARSLKPYYEE